MKYTISRSSSYTLFMKKAEVDLQTLSQVIYFTMKQFRSSNVPGYLYEMS